VRKAAFQKSRAKTQDLGNPVRKAAFQKSRAKTQDLGNSVRKARGGLRSLFLK
jgi:hypothetical protein